MKRAPGTSVSAEIADIFRNYYSYILFDDSDNKKKVQIFQQSSKQCSRWKHTAPYIAWKITEASHPEISWDLKAVEFRQGIFNRFVIWQSARRHIKGLITPKLRIIILMACWAWSYSPYCASGHWCGQNCHKIWLSFTGPLLLTYNNFNHNVDKYFHAQ